MKVLRELTEVSSVGTYTNVVPVCEPAPGYFCQGIPVPRVLCHGRTELTEVAGTGMNVTGVLEVRGAGNIPGMVLYVRYVHTTTFSLTEVPGTGMGVLQN